MPEEPQLEAETPNELRAELKTWEVAFTKANGRKPAREDIKKNAAIAAKYKEYDNARKRPARTHTTPRKQTRSTPKREEQNALREMSTNAIAATPSKSNKDSKRLRLPELSAFPEEEPTPAHIRLALGPTPQKDGAVLGIFDLLSAGTPSKGDANATTASEALVAGTPSKPSALPSSASQLSKTPESTSTRFHLDAFGGTPLKRKREGGDHTPGTSKKLFATPSFLRRNWSLGRIEEDTTEPSAAGPPFKKRGLVRSLSTIIRGLKQQEEDRMEDEWDIMNEIEAEERGEAIKPPAPPKILVEDSQAAEMPLGPDRGNDSSEDEGVADPGALDANGNPRKVWKKKGLKRQTRRVIMRPVLQKAKSAPSVLPQADGESDDEVVEETQMPEPGPGRPKKGNDEDDFIDDDHDSGGEPKHDSQQSKHEKSKKAKQAPQAKGRKKVAEEDKEEKKKPAKKVKPEAHANFRKLKIKNKNSKANGRGGRFGRR